MKLPKKINPCPIIEAIAEIRFESLVPADAILGVLYKDFKDDFPQPIVKLPILQIPEAIRLNDPNLLNKPYYQLKNGTFIFQIGPRALSVISQKEYVGWENYAKKINECFKKAQNLGIFSQIKRLGIRYVNFFDNDIFEKINLEVLKEKETLKSEEFFIRTKLKAGQFVSNLQIANKAEIMRNNILSKGSIIDIDTFLEKDNFVLTESLIEECRAEENKLFFSLLKEEFLKQLNPEY